MRRAHPAACEMSPLVAGDRNAPSVLILPFRRELIYVAA